MIIEAGYDIRELVLPSLLGDRALGLRPLMLVAMNADLRLLGVTRVVDDMTAEFEEYLDRVFELLMSQGHEIETLIPHYFAVAYMVPGTGGGLERHFHPDKLGRAAEDRGLYCIGEQVFDDEYWQSSGPMYSFEDYAMDELPRAMVYRGPHPFIGCGCPPCVAKEALIEEGRKRRLELEEETN